MTDRLRSPRELRERDTGRLVDGDLCRRYPPYASHAQARRHLQAVEGVPRPEHRGDGNGADRRTPAATTPTAANWLAPVNARRENRHVCSTEKPADTPAAPKATP